MNIDAHQHFWRYDPQEYGWIGPEMALLRKDHLPDDLLPTLTSAGIDATVAVQARQTLEETRWLLELADQHDFIKGVVGWVDLRSPQLREQLERFSRHPKFRGVRHVVQDEPDDQFMLREDFIRGLKMLAGFGLAFDILIFPRHLPVAYELVSRFPEQRFVLDHIAKPFIKTGGVAPWDAEMRRLAGFPNVFCKVSGMVTEAGWKAWKPADFRPYLDVIFEAFSPRRIMFGSDWPVCTVAASYAEVLSIVRDYIQPCSSGERALVLGENARTFYRIQT